MQERSLFDPTAGGHEASQNEGRITGCPCVSVETLPTKGKVENVRLQWQLVCSVSELGNCTHLRILTRRSWDNLISF